MQERYLNSEILRFLERKIVLLSGPRQAGKTTLSKNLCGNYEYLNYDSPSNRVKIIKREWDRTAELLILDELHKMKRWKQWLKGLYDTEELGKRVLVTGSARLDAFRKTGDSLAGRHYLLHLHPIDLKEALGFSLQSSGEVILDRLLRVSGFPEPFLLDDSKEYSLWAQTHSDIIIRQDLRDFEFVRELQQVELLRELLKSCVGSTVSYSSLGKDLGNSDHAVRRWLTLLEELYVVFPVRPYFGSFKKMIRKAPKYYFFDTASVNADVGSAFENLVACALLKEIDRKRDTLGEDWSLAYVRIDDNKEVDFLILYKHKPHTLIEVKVGDDTPSSSLKFFHQKLKTKQAIQLVRNLPKKFSTPDGVEVVNAAQWLSKMEWNQ